MTVVNTANAVKLNGTMFPITGLVGVEKTAVLPAKTVIGAYTNETDPTVNSWTVNDQRGGIGIEKMDPSTDNNRCWWSTCNLDSKGHILQPRYTNSVSTNYTAPTAPSITDAGFETWSDGQTLTNWTCQGIVQESTIKHGGSYSVECWNQASSYWYQDLSWSNDYRSKIFIVSIWTYLTDVVTSATLTIDDGISTSVLSVIPTTTATWQEYRVCRKLDASATRLRIRIDANTNGGSGAIYFDDVAIYAPDVDADYHCFANFKGDFYMSYGEILFQLTSGSTMTPIAGCTANITDMVVGNNNLYLLCGDDDPYAWMVTDTTGLVFSKEDGATLGAYWDGKLIRISVDGTTEYTATPNTFAATWTATGTLYVQEGSIKRLRVGFNPDANSILYASTTVGLKALDFDAGIWIDTSVSLGEHPNGGMGCGLWRDTMYVSAGLEVLAYNPVMASVESVGLTGQISLPEGQDGEIVDMASDYPGRLFVAVDASQVSGTNFSAIYGYDGTGWQCWCRGWAANEELQRMAIGSGASVYRLYFWYYGALYSIDVPRGMNNATVGAAPFNNSGVHISPWFDAGWSGGDKIALKLLVWTTNPTTSDQVYVQYRTDYNETDVSTGFTTMGITTTSGLTEYTFASGVGVTFKAIQIRFLLARPSSAASPEVNWFTLLYRVLPSTIDTDKGGWGYRFVVDCTQPYDGLSPAQLIDALIEASSTNTNIEVAFRLDETGDETYYGLIKTITGSTHTGQLKEGQYEVFVVIP